MRKMLKILGTTVVCGLLSFALWARFGSGPIQEVYTLGLEHPGSYEYNDGWVTVKVEPGRGKDSSWDRPTFVNITQVFPAPLACSALSWVVDDQGELFDWGPRNPDGSMCNGQWRLEKSAAEEQLRAVMRHIKETKNW